MDPVIVVGAGISGVTCARTVAAAGLPVTLLDRGHRIGGRMASRRIDDRPVDLGASYLTASDPRFVEQVERWRTAGLAHPWTDTFTVLGAGRAPTTTSGPMRWGTPAGLRSLVEELAAPLAVRRHEVAEVTCRDGRLRVDDDPASAVVLAMPDPQAARLLGPGLAQEATALDRPFAPVLALVATYAVRAWDLDGAFVNDDDDLAWVADDGRRRGDGAPVLVAHSTAELAARHLVEPALAEPVLVAALQRVLGLTRAPVHTHVHRWSVAKPTGERAAPYQLDERLLGVCGDGWGPRSKVEGAYLSGLALGEGLVARLG